MDLGPFSLDTIVCGDCLDVMRQMPDGCVDLVVADPPFNVGFDDYGTGLDDNQLLDTYLDWLQERMAEAERICRPGRLLFLWQAMRHCLPAWNRFPQARLFAACKSFVQMRKVDVQWSVDPVLFWHSGQTVYEFASPNGRGCSRDWIVGNHIADRHEGIGAWHPCPRPMSHVLYVISQWSNPGDLIFDPFMGSGTTAVAAKKLGRHYFGCDINPDYVRMANERVAKVDGVQLELTDAPERKPMQAGNMKALGYL